MRQRGKRSGPSRKTRGHTRIGLGINLNWVAGLGRQPESAQINRSLVVATIFGRYERPSLWSVSGGAEDRRWRSVVRAAAGVLSIALLWALVVDRGVSGAWSQWRQEAMTAAELQEVRDFAARFTQRLGETGDLTPLLKGFFVSHFQRHLRRLILLPSPSTSGIIVNNEDLYLFYLRPDLVSELSGDDLQRYFVHTINFWYLIMRYALSRSVAPEPLGDEPLESLVPEEVEKLFRNEQTFQELLARNLETLELPSEGV